MIQYSERRDIEWFRGDTLRFEIEHLDANDAPIDITDYSFFLTVKKDIEDADVDADAQVSQDTPTDPTNGKTIIELTAADLDGLVGPYSYDLQMKDADGRIATPLYGTITFLKETTRRTVPPA